MSDLISRAEAIKALLEDMVRLEEQGTFDISLAEAGRRAKNVINGLPSEWAAIETAPTIEVDRPERDRHQLPPGNTIESTKL